MSVVNVWVKPSKAMDVVDTEVADITNQLAPFEGSKMLYLPHANVLIANRGTPFFLNGLHSLMHILPHASLDEYAEAMPAILENAVALLAAQFGPMEAQGTVPKGVLRLNQEQQLVMVGYSHKAGEMMCLHYEIKDDSGFSSGEDVDEITMPWLAAWGPKIDVQTKDDARRLGAEQITHALRELPDSAHGGRLVLAELTRESCNFSTLATVTTRALAEAAHA